MEFAGKWLCAAPFDTLPLQVFHKALVQNEGYCHPEQWKNVHMYVRKELIYQADGSPVKMRVTADDYYKLYINGAFVAQGPAPGYYFSYCWNQVDVTPFLRQGRNVIALEIYYQGLINRVWNSGDMRQGFVCDLWQGNRLLEKSDASWRYLISSAYQATHTAGYDTQFMENVDSRREPAGWKQACFDDSGWLPCVEKKNPDYIFWETPVPTVETRMTPPQTTQQWGNNGVLLDFGKELAGNLVLRARGNAGDTVRIFCGEELDESGDVRYQMRCNCIYDETWTLQSGENQWEQYDYQAFRYVRLEWTDGVAILNVQARERFYPFPEDRCTLESADPVLSSVFEICKNGVKYGCQEGYVDCPSREKGQYAGDLTITTHAHIYLTGDFTLYRKALRQQMESAFVCPGLLAVTPGSFMQEIADYSLQFPLIALRYYQHTQDAAFLREMLQTCEGILAYFSRYARPDGLLEQVDEKWNLVDWPQGLRDNYDFSLTDVIGPGCHNVINAFYVGAVGAVEEIRRILGIPFIPRYKRLAASFQKVFYQPASGLYRDREGGTHSALHSNVLPAYFGWVPESSRSAVRAFFVNKGLCCGVYMSYFLLKGLCRMEGYEDAYRLIVNTTDHSWYNMVREGGTCCFEAWGKEQKANTSLCHPWASSPIPVLVEDLLGITPQTVRREKFVCRLPAWAPDMKMKVPCADRNVMVTWEKGEALYRIL